MDRRTFLRYGCSCGLGLACAGTGFAATTTESGWQVPGRFTRPEISSDEGGLWALMDRQEKRMRRSPFAIRDAALREYVQGIACRLAGEHCPDIRVYLVHTAMFNASMAPNGMMEVWSGLLLRVENEAQLAAVLGHEIGHYLERHSLERLRDVKSRSAVAQVLGLFGGVGAVGQLALLAGMVGYSRDQERAADAIGSQLMSNAGYDAREAAKIWSNLLLELKARPEDDPAKSSPLFAGHPAPEERMETLARLGALAPGGSVGEQALREHVRPYRLEWLIDDVKRAQYEESLALFGRMLAHDARQADVLFARGEARRLRAKDEDLDAAIADYTLAAGIGGEPPETHRGLGMILRNRKMWTEARASFRRYLEVAPRAPDAEMVKSYIEEMGT